jgi:hypothetical protein
VTLLELAFAMFVYLFGLMAAYWVSGAFLWVLESLIEAHDRITSAGPPRQ